ncbi:hypothetical protein [Paenimyroides aestuarii]|uniref:Outer membrane protein beta-barrel domain-containing protein n=1 Tax=Paenimyroides aestuarii TaxID=2968490 RepID=A0ABY5NQV2_9FLAO|nr:hypothetical protein [Paenimyroides aestuarii]UUV20948.1 hypothetical protein NPX36_11560 [Paenimyroides aestuarii]
MKKMVSLYCLLISFSGFSQNEKNSSIDFFNTFQMTLGFSNLAPNNSMMGDAHKVAFPSLQGRLAIISYQRFTVGAHLGFQRMMVKNNNYFGYFEKTTVLTPGLYASFYQPINEQSILEPYISYDKSQYTSNGFGKELNSESNGLGLGVDYLHKIGTNAYFTFGMKYSIHKMQTDTAPNWEKYMNNYQFLTAKIGITFSKNR